MLLLLVVCRVQALENGGGLYSLNSALLLSNVILSHNVAKALRLSEVYDVGGGALFLLNSGGLFQHCTMSGNRAAMGGAAVLVNSGPLTSNSSSTHPVFASCTVFENSATSRGGGFFAFLSYFDMTDTWLYQNNATVRRVYWRTEEGKRVFFLSCLMSSLVPT